MADGAGNASTIDQISSSNTASVDQTGSPSDAVAKITQGTTATATTDKYNDASVIQGGHDGNEADITQSQGTYGATRNYSNISNSNQQGEDGVVTVVQVGDNKSTVNQLSSAINEHAIVGQSNVGNTSSITQSGSQELALVNQEGGGGNSATIVQSGTGNGVYTLYNGSAPRGPGDLRWHENLPSDSVVPGASSGATTSPQVGAYIDQTTPNNTGTINQAGLENFADIAQGNEDGAGNGGNTGSITQGAGVYESDAVIYQDGGTGNLASISQTGAGIAYSTIWQFGNANQAYSTQVGSEKSIIAQGNTNEEGLNNVDPSVSLVPTEMVAVNNDYASVYQSGGGDYSLLSQIGDNDSATVSQLGANASSIIAQIGSSNIATVHQ